MTGHHSGSKDASKTGVELPDVVIAQAEAAATSNQPEDSRHHSNPVHEVANEPRGSEGGHASSSSKNNHAPANASETSGARETPIEQVPQVAYGPQLGQVDFSQDGFDTKARVAGQVVLYPLDPVLRY